MAALLAALAGLATGFALAALLFRGRTIELAQARERARGLDEELAGATRELARERAIVVALSAEKAAIEARRGEEQKAADEKIALLIQARADLVNQFQVAAGRILEEKTERFTEQNRESLGRILEPLKVQLGEFRTKVEAVYVSEGKDRSALAEQVRQLLSMNERISKDAQGLAEALKGSAKTRGNWGELVLERILESAGLRRGSEYDAQPSHPGPDGTRLQPDVVVHLPEGRHLVIDSKVTLIAFQEAVAATGDGARLAALKRHVDAVRGHVRDLSSKDYPAIFGLSSTVDFVILFVPIEPAFLLAVETDPDLWEDAWRRNVLLVSPSTLLFVLRTVAHLWHQEQQSRNVREIARRGAALYDKFVGFVEDLNGVGERLRQAQAAYEGARRKLGEGPGNLVRQAEQLRDLGVKPTKPLPAEVVRPALEAPEAPVET